MARPRRGPTLADLGEDELLARFIRGLPTSRHVAIGPGDDCARLNVGQRGLLWTTDSQIEGTHFERSWLTPRQLGRRAYLVNASDIAAMGGAPLFCLVDVAAPASSAASELVGIQKGLASAAARDGAVVVGGNVARSDRLRVTVSLLGEAPQHPLVRSGARAGDGIYVTGLLGSAALGLRRLRRSQRASGTAVQRFREPIPRLRAGKLLADRRVAVAAIDISDGFATDLRRLCRASSVGARIEVDKLPMSRSVRRDAVELALDGGEDYELLCAVPARKLKLLTTLADGLGCSLTRVGVCTQAREGVVLLDADGKEVSVGSGAFKHFSDRSKRRRAR